MGSFLQQVQTNVLNAQIKDHIRQNQVTTQVMILVVADIATKTHFLPIKKRVAKDISTAIFFWSSFSYNVGEFI
ncbi:MAG: hypothetical protein AUH84_03195 [Thaumarchaeota archaeon 13_1_40CM_4_38_7]|nr:MAG: hypothetical protein AUH84_03195 [Thaumarchaeota archaeon 13_1_40CM_4_38_7]